MGVPQCRRSSMRGRAPKKMKFSFFFPFSFLLLLVDGRRYSRYWLLRITDISKVNIIANNTGLVNHGQVGKLEDVFQFEYKEGNENTLYDNITTLLKSFHEVSEVVQEVTLNHAVRNFTLPTDPDWKYQWPWYNEGQYGGPVGNDLNIVPVWIEGVSGKGTKALIIDNGIQLNHPDLQNNIDVSLCYSAISYRDGTNNINPIHSLPDYNHGTSCAGEIAMIHDNGICGTGVAYDTTVAGFQVDFSDLLSSTEVLAFNHAYQQIDVYSNSWGPADNGYTVQEPSFASQSALMNGVNKGRNGLGSIYVFSSGNGGANDDSCAADGYASSIYTIAVGSADQAGRQAYYDENCSGKLAVTYSYNSDHTSDQVVTAYPGNECVRNFTGTSASAPLVSGAILLALEVNPNLSWRDVQYLIVYTSKSSSLIDGNFITNGAGLSVSEKFGFGAIDVQSLVTRARYWTPVGTSVSHSLDVLGGGNTGYSVAVTESSSYTTTFTVGNNMYLEHVIVTASIGISSSSDGTCYNEESILTNPFVINHTGTRRGDVSLQLCSPSGTCSTLLPTRHRDYVNCEGYTNWPFMSVHFWGENPVGTWQFKMSFSSNTGSAQLSRLSVEFKGVDQKPINIIDKCDPLCATPTGCSYGNGSQYCDTCKSGYYRNVTTLQCVTNCWPGSCIIENTCVFYNGTCPRLPSLPSKGLSQSDLIIIIICSGIALLAIIILVMCICICCMCCCGTNKERRGERRYQRLSFRDGPDVAPYVSYKEPSIV